jgi:hypothetical protein
MTTEVLHDASGAGMGGEAQEALRRCPTGTKVQTLVFERSDFSEAQAAAWAKRHGFKVHFLDVKRDTIHIRQEEPEEFVTGSFRTIRLRPGVKAVIGCPKGSAKEAKEGVKEEDHVHAVPAGTTGPEIPLGGKKKRKKNPAGAAPCCTPEIAVVRSEGYEQCLAQAAKLGPIRTPKQVYLLLESTMTRVEQETLVVVPLDARHQLRGGVVEVHKGARASVAVSTSEVLKAVLVSGADRYILVHCHPSGKCSPSKADRDLTKHIEKATKPLGDVIFLDHVVIGRKEFYSIREDKLYRVK